MQRTLGRGPEVRHQHFLEKLESIMKRFAPHLLDTEYDQKFAEDMQRADADESEDMDVWRSSKFQHPTISLFWPVHA